MAVCKARGFTPSHVLFTHIIHGFVFVAKDLHNLEAVNDFFHVAVQGCKGLLLLHKVWAAFLGNHGRYLNDKEYAGYHQQREPYAQGEHGKKYGDDGKEGAYRRSEGLHHHLAKGIHVVGIQAHDVAVFVAVEIANWQALHFFKHFVTHAFHGALCYHSHNPVVGEGGKHACPEEQAHSADGGQKSAKVRIADSNHWCDVVVNQGAQKERGSGAGNGTDEYQYNNHHKEWFVSAKVV